MTGDKAAQSGLGPLLQSSVLETVESKITDIIAILYSIARRILEAGLMPAHPNGPTTALSRMGWLSSLRRFKQVLFGAPEEATEQMRAVAWPNYGKALQQVDNSIARDVLGGLWAEASALLFYQWGAMDHRPVENLWSYSAMASRLMQQHGVRHGLEPRNNPLLAGAA